MKPKAKSKTLWFNWIITSGVTVAGVLVLYLPEFGLDAATTARLMFGLVLFTTFGNKYLRYKTKEGLK